MSKLLEMISDPHFMGQPKWEVIQEYAGEFGEIGLYAPIDDHPISKEYVHGFVLLNNGKWWHEQFTADAPKAYERWLYIMASFAGITVTEAV